MLTTTTPKPTDDPHDVTVVAPDVALMTPSDEELAKLARSLRHFANPQTRTGIDHPAAPVVPPVDPTLRPAAVGDVQAGWRTMGGQAARGVTAALLMAACTGAAAIAWQSYGGTAEQMIARWSPQRVLASLLPLEKPALPVQPTPPAVGATAANPTPANPTPAQSGSPAQTAPEGVAPGAVAPSVGSAPSLGSMTNDIASARQEIEQLKASIEELKASQQQMSRDIAKASAKSSESKSSETRASEVKAPEQNLRPKISAHPGRATTLRASKPMPPLPPQQAAAYPTLPQPAAPYVPRQAEPQRPTAAEPLADPELASVPRPPMPLR
ncbi:gas vesicle protein [Nitrobacteraceae bacterium AZCC 2146]